jgi:multidrug resistance efflux pump
MGDSGEALLAVEDVYYPDALARAFAAADRSPEPVQAGIEAAIEMAELDPHAAVAALWRLQADWKTLARLEEGVGGERTRATMRIGAAIHLARAELSSPTPQLRSRLPELLEWLAGPTEERRRAEG